MSKGRSVGLYIPDDVGEEISNWIDTQKKEKSLSSAIIDLIKKETNSTEIDSFRTCLESLQKEIKKLQQVVAQLNKETSTFD